MADDIIFICYRRQIDSHVAGRLKAILGTGFNPQQIFMDIHAIPLGTDFAKSIRQAIGAARVLLAVIGPRWTTVADVAGRPLLGRPDDYVELEIREALDRGLTIVPVLVDGTRMPAAEELPASLHGLTRLQGAPLRHESFEDDAARIGTFVRRLVDVPDVPDVPDAARPLRAPRRSRSTRRRPCARAGATSRPGIRGPHSVRSRASSGAQRARSCTTPRPRWRASSPACATCPGRPRCRARRSGGDAGTSRTWPHTPGP